MRFFIRRIVNAGLGFAMFLYMNGAGLSQTNDLRITLVAEPADVPEHLPAAFNAVIKNESSREVELYPYDINRLPETILAIKFESPLAAQPPAPQITDFGFTPVKIPPFETVRVKGYLQRYMRRLTPGAYSIPYSLHWEYESDGPSDAKLRLKVAAQGTLQFSVTRADSAGLNQYLSARTKIVQEGVDLEKSRIAAEEISLIDAPAVLPALMVLKDNGYELEALHAGERLPEAEALKILVAIADSSKNPAIVREAITEIEKRGGHLPDETVRTLLDSNNKWLQIPALEYAGRTARSQLLSDIGKLLAASDPDVREAAERASNSIRKGSSR